MTSEWNTSQHSQCALPNGPGDVIASLPALFGFAPDESLVVLSVAARPCGARICHVLRVDLDGLDDGVFERVRPLLELTAKETQGAVEFVLVILAENGEEPGLALLCARFAAFALPRRSRLSAAFWAPSTAHGAVWRALFGPRSQGVVADHRVEQASVESVFRGDVVAQNREQLRELLRPQPRDRAAVERAAARLRRTDRFADTAEREIFETIREPDRIARMKPEQAARFAVALTTRTTRDRLISATVEAAARPEPSGAELLWSRLVPMLPDAERAEAAVLLALAWYARGRGAAARVALEEALAAEPAHELASLVEACLFAGVRPDALQALVRWPE